MNARIVSASLAYLCTTALAATFATTSEARPRPKVQKDFEANKTFGLGLMLGSASGLSGKLYVSESTAIDFGIGAHQGFRDDRGLHIHADFLWHPVVLASPDSFELPLYLGLGFRYLDHDRLDDRDDNRDHEHLGIRGPVGLLLDFNRVPLDIFMELAMVLDVSSFDDARRDHGGLDIDGSIGLRYYF